MGMLQIAQTLEQGGTLWRVWCDAVACVVGAEAMLTRYAGREQELLEIALKKYKEKEL